jgi:tetrahydrodipicolinate N-succinyltransferase
MKNAQAIIEQAWEDRAEVTLKTKGNTRKAVEFALNQLDAGKARVAEKIGGEWQVNPFERYGTHQRWPRHIKMVGQGAFKI